MQWAYLYHIGKYSYIKDEILKALSNLLINYMSFGKIPIDCEFAVTKKNKNQNLDTSGPSINTKKSKYSIKDIRPKIRPTSKSNKKIVRKQK